MIKKESDSQCCQCSNVLLWKLKVRPPDPNESLKICPSLAVSEVVPDPGPGFVVHSRVFTFLFAENERVDGGHQLGCQPDSVLRLHAHVSPLPLQDVRALPAEPHLAQPPRVQHLSQPQPATRDRRSAFRGSHFMTQSELRSATLAMTSV